MNIINYRKKADPVLDAEWKAAAPYGKVRLGTEHLFWRKGLNWFCAALSEVWQVYRRVEEVNSKTCCCSSDFSIHKLILIGADGQQQEILIGDSLYRHEPELLLEALLAANPHIKTVSFPS